MKYKTDKNLKEIWKQLDDACGLIDNATISLNQINNLPSELRNNLDRLDFGILVALKNEVESLMESGNDIEKD